MKKQEPDSFEASYPTITRWIKEFGRIEIGTAGFTDDFVKAIDRDGIPGAARASTGRSTRPSGTWRSGCVSARGSAALDFSGNPGLQHFRSESFGDTRVSRRY
jgi:hypothetical protein